MDKKAENNFLIEKSLETKSLQASGDGTKDNPFIITDVDALNGIRNNLSAFYKLGLDIDLKGAAIEPIGTSYTPFTGSFDGDGHAIKNFVVTGESYVGLFGYADSAILKCLRVENASVISSKYYAGILIGYLVGGSVSECSVSGSVEGWIHFGGLIGYAEKNSKVSNSFAIGNLTSTYIHVNTGGLIGYAKSVTVKNCYAACRNNTNGNGLICVGDFVTVENSYYDSSVAGFSPKDSYNVGKLTAALIKKEFFKDWDFTNIWDIKEGVTYPYLRCTGMVGESVVSAISTGFGTNEDPYLLENAGGVDCMRYEMDACYRLKTDIDMNGEIIVPIGTRGIPFMGVVDGDGYTIKNFVITGNSCVGLFGGVRAATLKNLQLENVEVTASGSYAGILAAYMDGGSVSGCSVKGSVTGSGYVGGLIGYAVRSDMISNSFAIGSVKSTEEEGYAGGLVGYAESVAIRNCYAACHVNKYGSGLIYVDSSTMVENSYYDSIAAGISINDAYNNGKLTAALTRKEFFENWDFTDIWDIKEGVTYPYLRCTGRVGDSVDLSGIATGIGTNENPYLLENAGGIDCMRYELDACYKLTADIDVNGKNITPIGTSLEPFMGEIDGDGHTIKNLVINARYCVGLFGYARAATLKNLHLGNVEVTASLEYAGALVANLKAGSVLGCSASGSVTGSEYVGGLIGYAGSSSIISDSFAVGSVTSTDETYAAGLIGEGESVAIRNCYAACRMSRNGNGLICVKSSVTVENSYYDSLAAGIFINNSYNVGKLTSALTRKEFFKNWDFVNIWDIKEGATYPYLRCTGIVGDSVDLSSIPIGIGTVEDPYLVENAKGVDCIRYEQGGRYKLTTDIDMNGAAITPIGVSYAPFTGCFDGNGHTIKNFVINGSVYVGLFGYMRSATLKNLHLENVEVTTSGSYAGILAAYLDGGSVTGCSVHGTVKGSSNVGGLIGFVSGSPIKVNQCCASVNVTGSSYIGGLIGQSAGAISDSFAVGSVISTTNSSYVGGLLGYALSANLKNCYAACRISTNGSGLAYSSSTIVDNSYFDSTLAGVTTPIAQGKTTEQMVAQDTYIAWDFRRIWNYKEDCYPALKIIESKRQNILEVGGLHSTEKGLNSITLIWNPVDDAESYEVIYNDNIQKTDTNTCTLTELYDEQSYIIRIKALFADGSILTSNSIVEKIYTLNPKTDYAEEFIEKCEGQTWFMDEIENLLNMKGKCINTINSPEDFDAIYAIGLADRGISGQIPAAIGELRQLKYLYLANNDLNGQLPEELTLLEEIIEMDLSNNLFSD